MFELFVTMNFSAAHRLRDYDGNCARWHGHNWLVTLFVQTGQLDRLGIGIDFREIKVVLREIIAELDHSDLNALPDFAEINPTSEAIAQLVYRRATTRLQGTPVRVAKVTVCETPNTGATYSEP